MSGAVIGKATAAFLPCARTGNPAPCLHAGGDAIPRSNALPTAPEHPLECPFASSHQRPAGHSSGFVHSSFLDRECGELRLVTLVPAITLITHRRGGDVLAPQSHKGLACMDRPPFPTRDQQLQKMTSSLLPLAALALSYVAAACQQKRLSACRGFEAFRARGQKTTLRSFGETQRGSTGHGGRET